MKIAIAKELFHSGVLKDAHLCENPMGAGWILMVRRQWVSPEKQCEVIHNDKGETRVFKGIEAALKTAEEIGFKELLVVRGKG